MNRNDYAFAWTGDINHPSLTYEQVYELVAALEAVSSKDPISTTCGPQAPFTCENGCIGCVARAALERCRKA